MSTPTLIAIIFAPFVGVAIILYFFTRANIWKPEMLEAGESVLFQEEGVSLSRTDSSTVWKDLTVIITNHRIVMLKGGYRFMMFYTRPEQYQQEGKIKKSLSINRYNLFTRPEDIKITSTGLQINADTYLGQKTTYEILMKNTSALKNIFS